MISFRKWSVAILGLTLLYACGNSKRKVVLEPFPLMEPSEFVKMVIPSANPLTEKGVALGKQLFFDPILSRDSSISCASCHQPKYAFSDPKAFSVGALGLQTNRSAPSLVNIGYHYQGLFWDGRASTLEDQVLQSLADVRELASEWPVVIQRLQQHPAYSNSFKMVFQLSTEDEIQPDHVARAIAQYERSLVRADAKYDRYLRGIEPLNELEMRGLKIFFDEDENLPDSECGHCHTDPLFTSLEYFNNGLETTDSLQLLVDKGRGGATGKYYDIGKFKTPTLRNIALTAPYMHDGRFETLEEVIEHYNAGGHYTENASPNVRPLHLSDLDKRALLAFLHCLTDQKYEHYDLE